MPPTWLIVLGSIVLFLYLVLQIRISFSASFQSFGQQKALIQVIVFRFFRFPLYPKKPKLHRSRYTKKKIKEKYPAYDGISPLSDTGPSSPKKSKHKRKLPSFTWENLDENLRIITEFLEKFFHKLRRYVVVKIARFRIVVASDDAAKTALLYGATSQSLAYIITLLDTYTRLKSSEPLEQSLSVDFTSEHPTADVQILLSISLGKGLRLVFYAFWKYLQEAWSKKQTPKKKTTHNKSIERT